MSLFNKSLHYIQHPRLILLAFTKRYLRWLPDKAYLKLLYFGYFSRILNLDNPLRFTEKLQWLKLYNRDPRYKELVDKIEVKNKVSKILGKEYIIPTLGVWNSFDEIDFNKLPDKFVLKSNNGGGGTGIVIVKNKSDFDKEKARATLEKSMQSDIYIRLREWPYKDMNKAILAEQYMEDESGELNDYKFYCFNGEVKVLLIASNRFSSHNFNYYDREFIPLPIVSVCGKRTTSAIEKPKELDNMISIAERLSKDIPHVRIDLYYVKGRIYFGEYTFFDSSGYDNMSSDEWDLKFGSWLNLPKLIRK